MPMSCGATTPASVIARTMALDMLTTGAPKQSYDDMIDAWLKKRDDMIATIQNGVDGENVTIGKPVVEGVCAKAEVMEQTKGDKVVVFKYKAKKNIRKKQGHRQPYTKVKINTIG